MLKKWRDQCRKINNDKFNTDGWIVSSIQRNAQRYPNRLFGIHDIINFVCNTFSILSIIKKLASENQKKIFWDFNWVCSMYLTYFQWMRTILIRLLSPSAIFNQLLLHYMYFKFNIYFFHMVYFFAFLPVLGAISAETKGWIGAKAKWINCWTWWWWINRYWCKWKW